MIDMRSFRAPPPALPDVHLALYRHVFVQCRERYGRRSLLQAHCRRTARAFEHPGNAMDPPGEAMARPHRTPRRARTPFRRLTLPGFHAARTTRR
ncbi:MAG: hypothetical protein U1F11_07480 [Steroidobacteraceae bacterium]